jgi:nitrogen fixation/metabolism regulation signal transduction histidine kinase
MGTAALRRWRRPKLWPVIAFLLVLLVTLDLMSDAVQNSDRLSRAFVPLLSVVVVGLVGLAGYVVVNVVRLVVRYRRQAAGSRLTGRFVFLFAAISLLPVAVVYYYSLGFLLKGIDGWFDIQIDRAIEDSLALSQASLDLNRRLLVRYSEQLLVEMAGEPEATLPLALDTARRRSGALALTVMSSQGRIIGSSSADPTQIVPTRPETELLQQVRDGSNYVGLDTRPAEDLVIRTLVREPKGSRLLLQALFPTSERISGLSERLETAYNRYKELAYLRQPLKFSFSLTLSLVLLFGLLTALVAAFETARRLVAPITDIAHGTRRVAEGDYSHQLPLPKQHDELNFLVASFNAMTHRIAQARDAAERSSREVEAQRSYLQTVLGRLSTGVVAFDAGGILRTANPAAHQILRIDLETFVGEPPGALAAAHPRLEPWVHSVEGSFHSDGDWRGEVTLFGGEGRQVLMCRSTPFNPPEEARRGWVVVFDDITNLIKAERDAAWGEVARRLAHEIKNPLTPIQLSAERLRRKYLHQLPEQDARVLDRATMTIVQQVDAMKEMVNAFSDYARPPKMETEPLDLDQLLAGILELYRSTEVCLEEDFSAPGALVRGDPLRLRQVVHNLIKNAQEALEGQADGCIRVSTALMEDDDTHCVALRVEDNGPGFEEALLGRLFEPYVTTKAKGTGLGMAIVKKIIEEHGGMIWAENGERGARVVVRLPLCQGQTSLASITRTPQAPSAKEGI